MIEFYSGLDIELKVAALVCVACFLVQLFYVLRYVVIVKYRLSKRVNITDEQPPVSVVIPTADDWDFIEKRLPVYLSQDYANYEVVVVANDCSEDFVDVLNIMAEQNDRLKVTLIKKYNHSSHSNKLALTVGMKAAANELMLFTTSDSVPVSDQWLNLMSKGFTGSSIVLGYSSVERTKRLGNLYMRCSRLGVAMRWLVAAISGRTYRGSCHSIGYTKNVYFESGGFTHLRLKHGVDDLFIQKVATDKNVSVVIHPQATIRQAAMPMTQWRKQRALNSFSFRYYPKGVKFSQAVELLSRLLLFVCWVFLVVKFVLAQHYVAAAVVTGVPFLRLLLLMILTYKTACRLGDKDLLWFYPIYDLLSPLSEMALAIRRRIKPSSQLWI
ncbi:MAG: glycosyltransferase [Rikenellaceae bacterium]|nr:glycosyltransferase [Rikenellaceae bacterium]